MSEFSGIQWLGVGAIGLIAGLLSGALGVGSAVFLVPALVLLLAYPQKTAQGMALLVLVPLALTSGIRYLLNPGAAINIKVLLLLMVVGIGGALIGSSIAFALPESLLRKAFALFIIAIGVVMLLR